MTGAVPADTRARAHTHTRRRANAHKQAVRKRMGEWGRQPGGKRRKVKEGERKGGRKTRNLKAKKERKSHLTGPHAHRRAII